MVIWIQDTHPMTLSNILRKITEHFLIKDLTEIYNFFYKVPTFKLTAIVREIWLTAIRDNIMTSLGHYFLSFLVQTLITPSFGPMPALCAMPLNFSKFLAIHLRLPDLPLGLIQWGSKYQTCPVFEWSKVVSIWYLSGIWIPNQFIFGKNETAPNM